MDFYVRMYGMADKWDGRKADWRREADGSK